MPKINKVQKYAINWLSHQGMTDTDIANELKISMSQIQDVLQKPQEKNDNQKNSSKAKDLMITHTSGKKINSVAIMTKEASELGDASRNSSRVSEKAAKGIFRPKK